MRRVGRGPWAFVVVAAVIVTATQIATAAPGRLDRTFSDDGRANAFPKGASGYGVTVDARGRVVVVGYTIGRDADLAIARFRPTGKRDREFGGGDGRVMIDLGGNDFGFDVAMAPKGRIVVSGQRVRRSGSEMAVAVLKGTGKVDRNFSDDGIAFLTFARELQGANAVAVDPDGKIVIGGWTSNGGATRWALARLRDSGARDRSFGRDGRVTHDLSTANDQILDLMSLSGGQIVAVGSAESGTSPRFAVARIQPGGKLDRDFGTKGVKVTNVSKGPDTAYSVAAGPDGTIVAAGHVGNGGEADWGILRYRPGGRLDDTFHGDGKRILAFGPDHELARGVAVQPNGRIVVVGRIRDTDDEFGIARLKRNGGYDLTFSKDGRATIDFTGGSDTARAVVLVDGRIVVAGEAFIGGDPRFGVARLRGT